MSRALVLLHGFAGGPGDFAELAEHLRGSALDRKIVSPDLYQEKCLGPENGMQAWVNNFEDWLRSQKFTDVTVLGYSLGGRLALNWLVNGNSPLKSHVIAVSARPGLWERTEIENRDRFDQKWAEKFRGLGRSELNEQWQALGVFHSSQESRLREDVDKESLALCFENWSPTQHLYEWKDLVSRLDQVHWVYGALDQVYQPVVEQLQTVVDPDRLYVIDRAGHRVVKEASSPLAEWVLPILSD